MRLFFRSKHPLLLSILILLTVVTFQNCAETGKVYDVQGESIQGGTSSSTTTTIYSPPTTSPFLIPLVPGELDFGGMFGTGNGVSYVNPLTGTLGCPEGHTSTGILGTANLDWGLNFCWKTRVVNTNPRFEFGGLYGGGGPSNLSDYYKNPMTTSANCSATYLATRVRYTANLDWPLTFCYRIFDQTYSSAFANSYAFGGMYGYVNNSATNNPATGAASCPAGFTSTQVYGTPNLDYPVWICWKTRQ